MLLIPLDETGMHKNRLYMEMQTSEKFKLKAESESQVAQHLYCTFEPILSNMFCTYRFDHCGSALACWSSL